MKGKIGGPASLGLTGLREWDPVVFLGRERRESLHNLVRKTSFGGRLLVRKRAKAVPVALVEELNSPLFARRVSAGSRAVDRWLG